MFYKGIHQGRGRARKKILRAHRESRISIVSRGSTYAAGWQYLEHAVTDRRRSQMHTGTIWQPASTCMENGQKGRSLGQ
jgi:hypothetical protein